MDLLDVPVPIDTWDVFDRLFEWERRPLDRSDQFATSYLGAAVRSCFAQDGRKCYVVRVGVPKLRRVPYGTFLRPGNDLNDKVPRRGDAREQRWKCLRLRLR
jgi:hypothetical protein